MKRQLGIYRLLEAVTGLALIGILAVLLLQIVSRVFSLGSFPWTSELAQYLMITLVFLATPVILEADQHIKVDFFVDQLPKRARAVMSIVGTGLVAVFAAALAFSGGQLILSVWPSRTPALRMPLPLFYAGVFLGAVLLLLAAARKWYREMHSLRAREGGGENRH